jgi:GH25 family lysozyme M1 (1,4-beta-N-acetylmuramidase)/putative cell wall-binding protein
MLHGIDISGWQAGIQLANVPADFVIIKGTGGAGYVSAECDGFVQQAKAAGKLIGVYHFAREVGFGGTPEEEAQWFVDNCGAYFDGTVIPVLDFEQDVYLGAEWAKAWLDEVYRLTGVKPLFYSYLSFIESHDCSAIANADYGLWIAQYDHNNATGYIEKAAPYVPYWSIVAMYQYTSHGYLSGYGNRLDLDIFYGDADTWYAYAKKCRDQASQPQRKATQTKIGAEVVKYVGLDRFETCNIIDQAHVKANKVIVSGENFADGMSAAYFARKNNANVVFDQSEQSYGLETYIVCGGVSNKGCAKVISGADRYETNLAVLKYCIADCKEIVVTSGNAWADNASAVTCGRPILLVSDFVNANQIVELKKHEGLKFVIIGGSNAVTSTVEKQLAEIGEVERIQGENRYETSRLVAEHFYAESSEVILVGSWADAIVSSNIGQIPVLLISEDDIAHAKSYISSHNVKRVYAIGLAGNLVI